MNSIHALSTIFAFRGMGASGVTANGPSSPARTIRMDDQRTEAVRETADRPTPRHSALGIPNLLASALLQGGSRTGRYR
jgi:hypothetical protein